VEAIVRSRPSSTQWNISLALGICIAVSLAAPRAGADDELAKGHYMAGKAYYDQARYSEAIREFREAYRLSPKPALLFNIAQALERMGKLDEAVDHLKKYLAAPGVSDTAASERLKNLEERLKQTAIQLSCEVPGAAVLVDGKERGRTPISGPLAVAPGSHEIKVVREGYQPFSAFVAVAAGSLVQVAARLEAVAAGGRPSGGDTAAPARRRGYTWTWVVAGTSAALLITGAITGGLALSKADKAGPAGPSQNKNAADSARTLAVVSDVTIGVGAAAAVAATILFFYERGRARASNAAVVPLVGPSTAGLGASIDF
jgi:hypothetical protein